MQLASFLHFNSFISTATTMESSFHLLTLLLVLSVCAPGMSTDPCPDYTREHGRCMLFGQCGDSFYTQGGHINCFNNILAADASTMGTDFSNLLQDTCPQYVGGHVCCDFSQLKELAVDMQYPKQLFGRCPACLKNFLSFWCAVNCDPDQSLFMSPLSCRDGMMPNGTKHLAVTGVTVYVNNTYAQNLYRSCSHVQYPLGGAPIVDIMCGGAKMCNASAWLNYLGDPNMNHNSPFLVRPQLLNPPKATQPIEGKTVPCDTVSTQDACGCRDCYPPELCPSPKPHVLNTSFTISLTAKKPIYSVFQPYGVFGVDKWTFGPVFTNEVLQEAYAIQDHLINMVASGTLSNGTKVSVSLSDICYQPMAPVNTHCSIVSVLNYFQNNVTRLLHTENFGLLNSSYQIYYCTRDPTAAASIFFHEIDMPCLGAFGGPVYPELALKGYNDLNGFPNYNNATELVVSFVVKSERIPAALIAIWEEALLDYVSNYHGTYVNIVL